MNNKSVKIILFLAIAIFIALFFVFDLTSYLTIDNLKEHKASLLAYKEANFSLTVIIYFVVYVITTALSLPGAAVLTLAGGAIFGLVAGTIIVSFASTIGATLAFLFSRFLFRDAVQTRFGDKLKSINRGIEKEGVFYLFTLRLVPAFPFFMINLLMGLTPIKTLSFFVISQIGMLPGTIAFVNAGQELGKINSLGEVLSFGVIISFVILGVLPLILKAMVNYLRTHKVMKKYPKPKHYDYNLVVIGAGSGGLVSAYIAAAVKAKVALIEKHKMGGDCLNTGCVPSKALIRSARMLSYAKRAKEFGFNSASVDFDFSTVMDRVHDTIKAIEPHDSVERYTKLGVDCIKGEARILSPYEVEVNGNSLRTRTIIIATGGRPAIPSIPGIESIEYYTSDTIWNLRELPKKLLVLGGGPIGCELAQCFQRLGSKVSIIQRGASILKREDEDVIDIVKQHLIDDGIELLVGYQAKEFTAENEKKLLICKKDGEQHKVEFDAVLVALGRKANTQGFGLEDLGVELADNGRIVANNFLRTNYPNIYVCGDVTGPYQFTHFASHQAWYASVNALFSPFKKFTADYLVIPWCTFTDPEIARVGLNEKEAQEKGIPYSVTSYDIDDLDRAIADSEAHGVVKVLSVPGKDKILGVTIVGAHAGDLIAEFVLAMKHGLGLNKILGTIHIYPTLAEANKYAAGVWKRNNAPEKLLSYVEKFHAWRRGA